MSIIIVCKQNCNRQHWPDTALLIIWVLWKKNTKGLCFKCFFSTGRPTRESCSLNGTASCFEVGSSVEFRGVICFTDTSGRKERMSSVAACVPSCHAGVCSWRGNDWVWMSCTEGGMCLSVCACIRTVIML